MRLVLPSASATALFAASQAFTSRVHSAVAPTIDKTYNNSDQHHGSRQNYFGEECSFVNSFQRQEVEADIGILKCSSPNHVCIQDWSSSLGGRCTLSMTYNNSTREIWTEKRELQTCIKCQGDKACDNLSPTFIANNIGCGSCNGASACADVSASSIIGERSCNGNKACILLVDAKIGNNSCTGDVIQGKGGYFGYSCSHLRGTVGDNSCFEYAACYQYKNDVYIFNVENDACRGQAACSYFGSVSIGIGSCLGYYTCYSSDAGIGKTSCNAKEACTNNTAPIGDCLCNSYRECRNNTSPLPGPGVCPGEPTKRPTSKPTTSPSKPTLAPTRSPTIKPTTSSPTRPGETNKPTVASSQNTILR
eukprot:CCRYP_005958-RA/>CCRYP_005958-RA protein AED:0.44 eAED:0.44 QI:287/1/1/1/0.91/0.92/13/81/362